MQIALTSAAHRQAYVAMVETEHGLRCHDDIVCSIAAKLEQLDVYLIFYLQTSQNNRKLLWKMEHSQFPACVLRREHASLVNLAELVPPNITDAIWGGVCNQFVVTHMTCLLSTFNHRTGCLSKCCVFYFNWLLWLLCGGLAEERFASSFQSIWELGFL